MPEIFSYIQVIVDANEKAKFILTGSQNFLLSSKINQSLAGRTRILNLLPLSIAELRDAGYAHNEVSNYIFKGGYPRIYNASIAPHKWLPDYIQTYLERDVREFSKIKELSQFQVFLQVCAARIGQVLNYINLSNAIGVSDNTIRNWLSVLEASYIIYKLRPYYKNLGKRLIKSPKIYFYDTGLACHLLGIKHESQVSMHYLYGSLFENLVINELIKKFTNIGEKPQFYYWRESNGIEIDLLIDKGLELIPIEIKATQTLRSDFSKNIHKVTRLPDANNMTKGYVIYGGELKVGNTISWEDLDSLYTALFAQPQHG